MGAGMTTDTGSNMGTDMGVGRVCEYERGHENVDEHTRWNGLDVYIGMIVGIPAADLALTWSHLTPHIAAHALRQGYGVEEYMAVYIAWYHGHKLGGMRASSRPCT